jgi:hypothetical protein
MLPPQAASWPSLDGCWAARGGGYPGRVTEPAAERFWTRRLRWRLLGSWRWPVFGLLTLLDGVIIKALPPAGSGAKLIPAIIIASFGNLILVGLVAPWLSRALRARNVRAQAAGEAAPSFEITVDHVATVLMGLAAIGLVVTGLGNRRVVVAATDEVQHAGDAAQAYVQRYGTPEVKRNFDTLNTHRFGDGTFRMCVALDDRRLAYCMFVDPGEKPPRVRPDPDRNPNGKYFRSDP